ncbi:TPA: MarR family transcriptional regulator [Providencia rettgeri]|uniref:MarR family winged helix-turn-helix transcriptional regulator n=1 Tax=Providencia sp. PROV129 TaxID=2949839 RepID=UPI002349598E|nr:MarR family transcriptional regulator [Providencia sp. PROV129]HEC8327213.1 MarR family transcriptional regulator [Providencia rettgeri]
MKTQQADLWFSFVRAHRIIIRKIEAKLSEAKLPIYAWYDVLWGLESGENGTRRMHELADVVVIERYNLTRLIDRLEKEGLVIRSRSDDDRRASFATITEKGKQLRKQMWEIYRDVVKTHFLSQFSEAEINDFASALDKAAWSAKE